jgi:hypothetical protein
MVMLGMDPGPHLLQAGATQFKTFAWTVILANLLTIPLFLATVPLIVGLTAPRPRVIAPFALVSITTVIVAGSNTPFILEQFIVMSLLGVLLLLAGLPRAPFVLGFVMGPIVERALGRTVEVYGFDALARPGVIVLGALLMLVLFRLKRPRAAPPDDAFSPFAARLAFVLLMLLAAASLVAALSYPGTAGLAPIGAALIIVVAAAAGLAGLSRRSPTRSPGLDPWMGAAFAGQLVLALLVGLVPATLCFLIVMRRRIGLQSATALLFALLSVLALQLLFGLVLFERQIDFGFLGEAIGALRF